MSAAGLLAMMVCVELDQPTPWPHLAAAVAGATLPQIGSSIRARWSYLVEDKAALHTAYSFESVVDEGVFIVGPALVTGLATMVHPLAGLTFALVATVAGTVVLAGQRRTEPPATGAVHHDHKPGMPWRVLAPLIVSAFTMGALLGGAEVATVAFSDEARFHVDGRTAAGDLGRRQPGERRDHRGGGVRGRRTRPGSAGACSRSGF